MKAKELYDALIIKERANGEAFYCLADNSPEWMTDAIRACHDDGQELPNDWRYSFIKEAANAIVEGEESLEADIFNPDLIKWLGEFPNAAWYCDEAYDTACDIITMIAIGQGLAKNETLDRLRAALGE